MSKYTTGEIAKLCNVTVRTVQYYDTRGILEPSELSEGGRRLYTDEDLQKMKIICFLRDLGLPIDSISQILSEEDPSSVIALLLEQQEADLKSEIDEKQEKLTKINELKEVLSLNSEVTLESIGDVAYVMSGKKELTQARKKLIFLCSPITLFQWAAIILWIVKGWWWLFLIYMVISLPIALFAAKKYLDKVAYICPHCHKIFRPTFREALWAKHTPSTRRLTCTKCKTIGFCVEVAAPKEEQ